MAATGLSPLTAAQPARLPGWASPRSLMILVTLLTVFRLWTGANAGLVEDEAYYRLWGLFPAIGYYDHPPMVAWWIWLGQALAGDTALGLRLMGILSAAVGSLALWRMADLLFGRVVAGYAVVFLNATLLVGIGGILITPDAPSVLFWGLTLWALAELVTSGRAGWWLAVGVFAGLGLLSKYSVLFLGAGIVLWLVAVPSARRWFLSWQLWAGGLLALALFAPVLVWNHANDWASFYKQFGRAGRGEGLTGRYIFEFIGAFVGLMNPLIAVPAVGGAVLLARRLRQGEAAAGLLLLTSLPFLAYLCIHALQSRVQGNWPAPLFPVACVLAAVFVAAASGQIWRRVAAGAVLLGLILGVLVQLHAVDAFTGRFARKDPTFQLRGWPEITGEVEQIAAQEGAAYVATTAYGMTGQLAYGLRHAGLPVVQLNERIRYRMMPAPDPQRLAATGLYVAEARRDEQAWLTGRFEEVTRLATLTRTVEGRPLEDLVVYRLVGPRGDPLEPIDPSAWLSGNAP
ncbi:glycosyl transferase family 39 [Microvirga tunisiensis]|uniref:Glycosyl transferase family 39 n=1 Tax=Pannonibacter tanglangensis TaxID=2750084 RepID=A0A7X5F3D1_9HYPH|nr:glycosyltransferase family 39 protein [Pannonibacter sp. XCT-53]NBN79028.1 glycosyl transferase family 39 [Pannonibacter sp. XCT-53]